MGGSGNCDFVSGRSGSIHWRSGFSEYGVRSYTGVSFYPYSFIVEWRFASAEKFCLLTDASYSLFCLLAMLSAKGHSAIDSIVKSVLVIYPCGVGQCHLFCWINEPNGYFTPCKFL